MTSSLTHSSRRSEEIVQLAEQVAQDHYRGAAIDPVFIIESKGISLSFNHYGDFFDGMLEYRAGHFHIYCNLGRVEYPHSSRARFTLAHELGHYFIDEHRRALSSGGVLSHPSKCEFESKNLAEREADLFASNLLMPLGRFLQEARKSALGLAGIRHLAGVFKTSITSTAIRYATCDVLPCAVLKWGDEGLSWKWLSSEAYRAQWGKAIQSLLDVPDDSATAVAKCGAESPPTGFFERGSTVSTWFHSVRPESSRNVLMIEQAMSLGRFGVLTFLYPESAGR